jgi:hypothetical protein
MKSLLKLPPEFRNGFKDRKRLATLASVQCIICSEYEAAKNPGRHEIHHFIGCGIGKKASDLLTIPLCFFHHQANKDATDPKLKALSVHGLTKEFEKKFGTQLDLLKLVNSKLGCEEQYQDYYEIMKLNQ